MRQKKHSTEIAIAMFALTFAKAILVFCVMLFLMISPKQTEGVKPKADFIVTLEWPGDTEHDVDLWAQDPAGNIAFFRKKESGFMTLERDDLGRIARFDFNGAVVSGTKAHEEILTLRGTMDGEYVFNAHLFRAQNEGFPTEPFNVTIRITRINPLVEVIMTRTITLTKSGQEETMARMTLDSQGNVINITTDLPTSLLDKVK